MAKKKTTPQELTQTARLDSTPVQAQRKTVASPNLVTMYANGFQIAIGPLDVRMYVIETVPATPTEVVDQQLAAIVMAPEALKLLADNIGKFVKTYEDNFGKIRDVASSRELMRLQASKS